MEINLLNLRKSINKAYLKVKPNRAHIETFKKNISNLFDQIKESESEEFHKNIISEFLKNTFYSPNNYINTKGRSDLVIHNGKDSKSTVGVLFEVKKPSNKSEMPTCENINTKAFHELFLYYLRERITNKNIEVKHLVITNIFEWFIFNASDFERIFANDKSIVKQFTDFEEGRLPGTNTDFFYKNIAEPFCNNLESPISVTNFNIRDFKITIKNANKEDDNKLITLYKILSPEHLLKLPFANDSNNLDKTFYNELLHIIGLEETKEGSKKLIGRQIEKKRNPGSLIENSITILKYEDCLSQLKKLSDFGINKEQQLFNIALELVITWINRILFLKLLEGQLIKYNNGDKTFRFLNIERIHDYDELNKLFFQVLAVKETDRSELIKQKFGNIPYLNSSLFEPSDLEHKTIRINSLDNHSKHPVLSATVLKDNTGKKLSGEIDPLQYLFEFLDSYDFSSEGSEDIQEENKTLINASVLGLIFEKINGYKDGSFFTPGFITMYICHETIRRAVVQKFNETKGWNCETISDVYNKIENIKEANIIINSLKVCDPAVGSGHFLVSALNELIAIKSELKILADSDGKRLKEYTIEVINDELIITDEHSKLFEYNPKSKESQRVQETLFQEKQKIIESCLFGVDINPNSVKICRLRLWIELLKNSYYKPDTNYRELETLPNIDINIKCGNSLISRYQLDADIRTALKSSKWTVDNYREAVMTYRKAQSKDEKRAMERLINTIKNDFETVVSKSDKRFLKLNKLNGELLSLTSQASLFELTKTHKDKWNKKVKNLSEEIKRYETEIDQIKSNRIYENAFEWRFEFPEVLNNDGGFVGFDAVIGNPPYVNIEEISWDNRRFYETIYKCATGRFDLYSLFIEKSLQIKAESGGFSFIIPGKFLNNKQFATARKLVCANHCVKVVKIDDKVFYEAQVDSAIISNHLSLPINHLKYSSFRLTSMELKKLSETEIKNILIDNDAVFRLEINSELEFLILKIEENTLRVREIGEVKDGIVAGEIKDLLFLDKKLDKNCKKLYFGKHLSKYYIADSEVWVNYKPDEMMREEIKRKGDKRPGLWMRDEKIFTREKILSRFVAKEIIATYDNEMKYYEHTLHSTHITDKRFKVKYILGLFNSKLFKFYYKRSNSHGGNLFPQVRISSVENLPIKLADEISQKKIEGLVDQILSGKKKNPFSNLDPLEEEIDRLVYKLYELTDEEIRIVETSEIP